MIGGRRTHDFPNGTPLPLTLTGVGSAAAFLAWAGWGGPSKGWLGVSTIIGLFVCVLFLYSKLITHYERTGRAVPIVNRRVVVHFRDGFPLPMLCARLSFALVVAIMLFFSFWPLPDSIGRRGIIGCVFGLVAVALVNIALENHYVKKGRADELDTSRLRRT